MSDAVATNGVAAPANPAPVQGDDTSGDTSALATPPDLQADLMAAVSEAFAKGEPAAEGGGDDVPATPPPAKDTTAADPNAATAADAGTDANEPAIAAKLRARREAQKTRETARSEAEQLKSQMLAEGRSEIERMRSEMRAEMERERAAWRQKLHDNPLEAITSEGLPVDRLVSDVAREGSPEWKLIKQQQKELAELRAAVGETKSWREEQAKEREEFQKYQAQQARQQAVKAFTNLAAPDKAPTLRKSAEALAELAAPFEIDGLSSADDWLVFLGDRVHDKVSRETGGAVDSYEDLVQFMEYKAARQQGVAASRVAGQPQASAKGAGQQRAQGPRTLSAATASERRTAAKPASWSSEEDMRADLHDTIAEVWRSAKKG